MRILDRYLIKEVLLTLSAVTIVLLAALLVIQLGRLLGQAAEGSLTQQAIWMLLGLEAVRHLADLVPPATLITIMLVLGRWYRDHEIIAATACGIGPGGVYRPLLLTAIPLGAIATILTLYLAPTATSLQYTIRERAQQEASRFLIQPGTFRIIDDGGSVIYVGDISDDNRYFTQVFLYRQSHSGPSSLMVAERGHLMTDPQSDLRYFELQSGHRYEGEFGRADFLVSEFDSLRLRIDVNTTANPNQRRKALPTAALLGNSDLRSNAEIQRRISPPIVLLVVTLMAPLLARSQPRDGRASKIVVAVLVYAAYNNLIAVAEAWYANGTTPPTIGLWWVHALFFSVFIGHYILVNGVPFTHRHRVRP